MGFNTRPIVESWRRYFGKQSNLIAAVDYFADVEIRACSDYLFSVLKQTPGEIPDRIFHQPPGDYLTELAEILADEINVGIILLGSGLDDRPDLWRRLSSLGKLSGNDPDRLAALRRRETLFKMAKKIGLAVPEFNFFSSFSEFEEKAPRFEFPFIVRREGGGGGSNIFKCSSEAEAAQAAHSLLHQFGQGIIESYEEGTPASVSILGSPGRTVVLSFNEQLIGCKSSFCPTKFTFCGNITPLRLPSETRDYLAEQFTKLSEELRLVGSNGVDFILRNDEACILELNPRFQGSLEPIELAYDLNLVEAHLKCFSDGLEEPPAPKRVAVRKILYAPKQITVPELSASLAKDRPIPGVILSQQSPFVSVLAQGKTRADVFRELQHKEQIIWKKAEVEL